MKKYLIGEIAKITGLSVHALRYYEKHNVIKPSYVDEETSYRYYSPEDVSKFELLKECKKMELSLEQVKQIFAAESDDEIIELIEEKEEEIQRQLKHYETVLQNVQWYRKEYDNLLKKKRVCYKTFVQHIARRRVIYRENPYEESASVLAIAEITKDELRNTDSIPKKFGFIANSRYWEEETSLRVAGEYIDLMKEEYRFTKPSYIFDIPAGTYLCMNVAVSAYLADAEVNAKKIPQLLELKEYMREHNYVPKMIIVEEFAQSLKVFERVRCQVQILLEVQEDGEF